MYLYATVWRTIWPNPGVLELKSVQSVQLNCLFLERNTKNKHTLYTSLMSPFPWIFQPFLNRKLSCHVLGFVVFCHVLFSGFAIFFLFISLGSLKSPVFVSQLHPITNHLTTVFSFPVLLSSSQNPHLTSCHQFYVLQVC